MRLGIGAVVFWCVLSTSPYVAYLAGDQLQNIGMDAAAIKCYDYATWKNVQGVDVYLKRAISESNLGNYSAAALDASRSWMHNEKNAIDWAERGFAYEKLGEKPTAQRMLEEALILNPKIAIYYHQRAFKSIRDNRDPHLTLELARRAITLDPNLGKAYINQANAEIHLGRYEDAIRSLDTGFSKSLPNDYARVAANNLRAFANLKLGRWADAERDAERFLGNPQADDGTYAYYGCALLEQGKYAEAIQFCDRFPAREATLEDIRNAAMLGQRHGNVHAAVNKILDWASPVKDTSGFKIGLILALVAIGIFAISVVGEFISALARLLFAYANRKPPDPPKPAEVQAPRELPPPPETKTNMLEMKDHGVRIDLSKQKEKSKVE